MYWLQNLMCNQKFHFLFDSHNQNGSNRENKRRGKFSILFKSIGIYQMPWFNLRIHKYIHMFMMEQQVNRTEEESRYRWFFLLFFLIENNFCSHTKLEKDRETNVTEEWNETEWKGSRKEEKEKQIEKGINRAIHVQWVSWNHEITMWSLNRCNVNYGTISFILIYPFS